jgi:hypothetical protein
VRLEVYTQSFCDELSLPPSTVRVSGSEKESPGSGFVRTRS